MFFTVSLFPLSEKANPELVNKEIWIKMIHSGGNLHLAVQIVQFSRIPLLLLIVPFLVLWVHHNFLNQMSNLVLFLQFLPERIGLHK